MFVFLNVHFHSLRCPLFLSSHVSGLQQQEYADNLEGLDITVSENVPPPPPPPQLNMESKSLQTDESDTQPQVSLYKCSRALYFSFLMMYLKLVLHVTEKDIITSKGPKHHTKHHERSAER